MLMFRFWGSESRGSDTAVHIGPPAFDLGRSPVQSFVSETSTVTSSPRPLKRSRPSSAATIVLSTGLEASPALKRQKLEDGAALFKTDITPVEVEEEGNVTQPPAPKMSATLERAKEVIELEFSSEILLKHQEHRLINQELAKCQVALEQLRRCHLIPYPVNVPTPENMLSITSGRGPALQAQVGARVPQWAPPFGVIDGPYARHYAKWLIPDPKFDGVPPPVMVQPESTRARHSVDSRSARHSVSEAGTLLNKGRRSRESAGQKLQALPSGYTQPKGKAGPCVLKRAADGKMVKLVCVTCHREDFSSTQGFINHCRIAHKQEYKSHEEAAIACGHPIEVDEAGGVVGAQQPVVKPAPVSSTGPARSHARESTLSYSDACFAVVNRINDVMESIRSANPTNLPPAVNASATFKSSSDAPNLSELAKSRGSGLDMAELVRDAQTKIDFDALMSLEEDMEDSEDESPPAQSLGADQTSALSGMRMPVRKPVSPVPPPVLPVGIRPSSSSGRSPPIPYATPIATPALNLSDQEPECSDEDAMDLDLSPNPTISNNAPSLVSDDDDYDDSVDGSCDESEVDDNLDTESMTDVAEIHFDDEGTSVRHGQKTTTGSADPMQLRKQEEKHVTFMSPVRESPAPMTPSHGSLKRKNRI